MLASLPPVNFVPSHVLRTVLGLKKLGLIPALVNKLVVSAKGHISKFLTLLIISTIIYLDPIWNPSMDAGQGTNDKFYSLKSNYEHI